MRLLTLAMVALLAVTACADDDDGDEAIDDVELGFDDGDDLDDDGADDGDAVDAPALTGDVDCDPETLGEDDIITYVVAHEVVDGELGGVCLGEEDDTLLAAWNDLAAIAPASQRSDLTVFAGVVSDEDDEVTLAFVAALDPVGTSFQMAVNLDTYGDDEDEALLTMAHEFSHVFTATELELDRSAESAANCATYDNGEGCYLDGSLMWAWIQAFWGDGLLDEVDPFADATADDGQDRCDREPGFFGAYGATNPEEDFAEAFGAYVLDVAAASDAQQAKLDWIDARPGLAEFRDRADASGFTPVDYEFDPCGGA